VGPVSDFFFPLIEGLFSNTSISVSFCFFLCVRAVFELMIIKEIVTQVWPTYRDTGLAKNTGKYSECSFIAILGK
jgi:hypothetical protein